MRPPAAPIRLEGVRLEDLPGLTCALAAVLAPGDVLFLYGELGAGKTTFTQHLARALGVGEEEYVSSPSFALLHEYHGGLPVYHLDLYRLGNEEEVEDAGLLEAFDQQGMTIVEWPDRLGRLAPAGRLEMHLAILLDDKRTLTLEPVGSVWHEKMNELARLLADINRP